MSEELHKWRKEHPMMEEPHMHKFDEHPPVVYPHTPWDRPISRWDTFLIGYVLGMIITALITHAL
jgi:hypothetical protein